MKQLELMVYTTDKPLRSAEIVRAVVNGDKDVRVSGFISEGMKRTDYARAFRALARMIEQEKLTLNGTTLIRIEEVSE